MMCQLAASAYSWHRRAYNRKYHADVSAIATGLALFLLLINELCDGVSEKVTAGPCGNIPLIINKITKVADISS